MKFEGDSQPLGYSIYDQSTGTYRELRDRPLSTATPDEERGFDEQTTEFVNAITVGVGGRRFF